LDGSRPSGSMWVTRGDRGGTCFARPDDTGGRGPPIVAALSTTMGSNCLVAGMAKERFGSNWGRGACSLSEARSARDHWTDLAAISGVFGGPQQEVVGLRASSAGSCRSRRAKACPALNFQFPVLRAEDHLVRISRPCWPGLAEPLQHVAGPKRSLNTNVASSGRPPRSHDPPHCDAVGGWTLTEDSRRKHTHAAHEGPGV